MINEGHWLSSSEDYNVNVNVLNIIQPTETSLPTLVAVTSCTSNIL